ncbi:hypothetical protein BET73_27200 [Klebsiella pneumoniae]|nr:hypothetical protein [Klebsiella pneumoniae]
MFAGKKSAQIREILISESAWEEMTCLFAPSLIINSNCDTYSNNLRITTIHRFFCVSCNNLSLPFLRSEKRLNRKCPTLAVRLTGWYSGF